MGCYPQRRHVEVAELFVGSAGAHVASNSSLHVFTDVWEANPYRVKFGIQIIRHRIYVRDRNWNDGRSGTPSATAGGMLWNDAAQMMLLAYR